MLIFNLILYVLHGLRHAERRPLPLTRDEAEALLAERAKASAERLDVAGSIVDVMKALGLDSGLPARKQLAQELGYTGALDGSAEMNRWLRERVLERVENHQVESLRAS